MSTTNTLKLFKRANNLNQEKIAQYLGLSRGYVGSIDAGYARLNEEIIDKLVNNPYGWDTSMLQVNEVERKQVSKESQKVELLQEKVRHLEELLQEKERLIQILLNKQ